MVEAEDVAYPRAVERACPWLSPAAFIHTDGPLKHALSGSNKHRVRSL